MGARKGERPSSRSCFIFGGVSSKTVEGRGSGGCAAEVGSCCGRAGGRGRLWPRGGSPPPSCRPAAVTGGCRCGTASRCPGPVPKSCEAQGGGAGWGPPGSFVRPPAPTGDPPPRPRGQGLGWVPRCRTSAPGCREWFWGGGGTWALQGAAVPKYRPKTPARGPAQHLPLRGARPPRFVLAMPCETRRGDSGWGHGGSGFASARTSRPRTGAVRVPGSKAQSKMGSAVGQTLPDPVATNPSPRPSLNYPRAHAPSATRPLKSNV